MAAPPEPRPGYRAEPPPELIELGARLRGCVERLLRIDRGHPGFRADLAAACEMAESIHERLAPHVRGGRALRTGQPDEPEDARPYYVDGPLLGAHHPLAPQVELEHVDGVTRGSVEFGVAFEGPPGLVHGGYLSFFFDAVLGHHNVACGIPGMTANLSVRYRRPTPLLTRLAFEVRTARHTGRKIVTRGWIRSGDQVLAEAEGLFVRPGTGFETLFRDVQDAAPGDA